MIARRLFLMPFLFALPVLADLTNEQGTSTNRLSSRTRAALSGEGVAGSATATGTATRRDPEFDPLSPAKVSTRRPTKLTLRSGDRDSRGSPAIDEGANRRLKRPPAPAAPALR